ncbi:MAG TPA: carbohydrate-binding protein [Tepidisphaeraceae bacterium]|nr:carbohydrate-binding protein [Tepidisphaeraceae bacterium]
MPTRASRRGRPVVVHPVRSASAQSRGPVAAAIAAERLECRRFLAAHIVGSPTVYATIQAAVDAAAPGATITVDPGVYSELVAVFKTLTIKGPQAGVDARSNTRTNRAAEAVVNGALTMSGTRTTSFRLAADNIVLDGFTVEGQNDTVSYHAGIHMNPGRSGIQVLNNIVQNNATGLNFTNGSATIPAIIRRNLFRENNNNGPHTGRAIYTDGSISGGTLTNVTIDQNAFVRNLGQPGFRVQPAIGIEALTSASTQTNIRITNNTFDRNGKHLLAFNASGLTITGNFFQEANDTTSAGLRFEGGISNVTIQNNNVYGTGARAIRIDKKAFNGPNTNFTITNNNFWRTGLDVDAQRAALYVNAGMLDGPVNASNNYWGAASGPSGDWSASAGTGDAVLIFGNPGVTVTPFATAPLAAVNQQGAYWGAPQQVTSTIQFEDFDHGGQGVAYSDTTGDNIDDDYHAYEAVDINQITSAGPAEYYLSNVRANEWLEYTVNVPLPGTFTMQTRLANAAAGGAFRVEIDGANVSGTVAVPSTGGLTTFTTISTPNITLPAGVHVMRVFFQTNASGNTDVGSFDWIRFTQTAVTSPAAPTNLAAAAVVGASQVNLTWQDNANNETGFIIERSSNGLSDWTAVATRPADTVAYADSAMLAPGVRFHYRVRSTAGAGLDSANSNLASAIVWSPALSAPSAAKAVAVSATQVNVTWIDTVTNEQGFKVERSTDGVNFAQVGAVTAANATGFTDSSASAGVQYWYRVCAFNASGSSFYSGPSTVTTPGATTLPAPWQSGDIGAVAAPGSATHSGGTYTVKGSGADIWTTADEFHFAYRTWSGNGTLVARVASMQNTNANAKAGIMWRESLAAGSTHGSMFATPGAGVVLVTRSAAGGVSDAFFTTGAAPIWLKLTRNGTTLTAAISANGITWTSLGSTTLAMATNLYVGLAVSSKNDGALNTATFDNVSVSSALTDTAQTADGTTADASSGGLNDAAEPAPPIKKKPRPARRQLAELE